MLKNLIKSRWGQDKKTLIRLAIIISCRSKATYGQTIDFSAPKSYLKKLQSLDSKAIKLALGISVMRLPWGHIEKQASFHFMKIRKLAAAKYIIRGSFVENHTETDFEWRSDEYFPKRANNGLGLLTIASNALNV